MKKETLIPGILLTVSVLFNFILLSRENTTPCDNKGRYPEKPTVGATRLDKTTAGELVQKYREANPPSDSIARPTGFVFTKKMFDEVFEDAEVNSVTLDLVTYDNSLSLVVKGYKTMSTEIDGEGAERIYVIRSFCPMDCSVW